ncbi:MAG TPA: hypothetical protein VG937_24090 [Polyangiaceae bacterium]|nr:hypothetical protein [Polyangiaceae bacterium]
MAVLVSNLRREGSAVLVDAKVVGAESERYIVRLRRVGAGVMPSVNSPAPGQLMAEILEAACAFADDNDAVLGLLSRSDGH